ncbi:Protein of unknown function [Bacillus mycoides]|jgi:hypothetical protein
MEQ